MDIFFSSAGNVGGGVVLNSMEHADSSGDDSCGMEEGVQRSSHGHHRTVMPNGVASLRNDGAQDNDDITVEVLACKFYLSAVSFPVDVRAMESCTICRVCLADPPLGLRGASPMGRSASPMLTSPPSTHASPSTLTAAAATLAANRGKGRRGIGLMLTAGGDGEHRAGSVSPRTGMAPLTVVAEGLHTNAHTTTTTALYSATGGDGVSLAEPERSEWKTGTGRRQSGNGATKEKNNEVNGVSRHGSIGGPVNGLLDTVLVSTGRCGHAFHTFCLDEWKRTNSNCPLCDSVWEEPDPPRSLE